MGLRFKVMNRADALKFVHEFHDEPFYVISIHSSASFEPQFDMDNECLKDVLYMQFSDTDEQGYYDAITEEDGMKIYRWAKELPDDALVVVHCRAGRSRSPAVVAALSYIFNGNDDEFWKCPPYTPNFLVYRFILYAWAKYELFHMGYEKLQKNLDEFSRYRQGSHGNGIMKEEVS